VSFLRCAHCAEGVPQPKWACLPLSHMAHGLLSDGSMSLRLARSGTTQPLDADARATAKAAGLAYVSDAQPGITRVLSRGKFSYKNARGQKLTRAAELNRIRALAVPPAWTQVWICPIANGHIQAVGRDARGRKQYRYHARWSAARDLAKHTRMCDFARRLQRVRAHCRTQLQAPGLTRDKVLSALLCIVDITAIRVGNEEYARENASFGLTTLRKRHVRVRGGQVVLHFRGKSGIVRHLAFSDSKLAQVVAQCRATGSGHLFKYHDEKGVLRRVHSQHLNSYLRNLIGEQFSVKDFRTWSATVRVAVDLARSQPASTQRAIRQTILSAVRQAALHLGNTPAICRKSYVHPLIFEAFAKGHVLPNTPKLRDVNESYARHEKRVRRFLLELTERLQARAA
jgi:DNA topoisomerase-1